ncbi:MAG: hypothetical protein R2850_09090, partial [Bacteroidia bacterium]
IPYLLAKAQQSGIELQWPAGDKRIAKVRIERSFGEENKPEIIGIFPAETGKYLDEKVENGSIYYYRIISILANGEETQAGNWVGASK